MTGAAVADGVTIADGGAPGRGLTVAVLAFDGVPLFDLAVATGVFGADRAPAGAPRHDVVLVAGEDGPVRSEGVTLDVSRDPEVIRRADLVVVPWWRHQEGPAPRAALEAVRGAHAAGAAVAGLCSGVFAVAEAGLLDGRRATTHWSHVAEFARRHQQVQVDPDALFVDEGRVLTAAGYAGGIDLCLHVLRRTAGADVAVVAARRMVVPPPRAGGAVQLMATPAAGDEPDDRLPRALRWALAHLDRDIDVQEWSTTAYMSPRTFARRFRAEVGTTPHQWLLHQRVLRAQQLLETTDMPVERIADAAGFGSPMALRPHFRRTLGCPPARYRARFRERLG
jgi:transcriptional regulator GlxA family with amidase domain